MISSPKLLLKMFLDRREYRGLSEFRFRPHFWKTDGMNGIDVISGNRCFTTWLRPHSTDSNVFSQVLLANDYNLRRFSAHYDRVMSIYGGMQEPLILDLGANIGMSALYFAKNFERAQIIAVEPDPANFHILKRSVRNISQVTALNAAIASRDGRVDVIESDLGAWASQTIMSVEGRIPAISIRSILNMYPKAEPFIAKIDIEGAEEELFSDDIEWVDRVPLIIIETHDWMLPGRAISKNFLKAICGKNRDFLFHSENIFSVAN